MQIALFQVVYKWRRSGKHSLIIISKRGTSCLGADLNNLV